MPASTPPSLRNAPFRPNGNSYTPLAVRRYGRPPLLPCQVVGSRSNSLTVRFSRTLFAAYENCPLNPFANRRLSWTSSECTLTAPRGRLLYTRPLLPTL